MCFLRSQWMSGNGVHIFSIMITFYAIYNPVKTAFTVNTGIILARLSTRVCNPPLWMCVLTYLTLFFVSCASLVFARFVDAKMSPSDRNHILTSKLMFVLCNMLAMSGALYKVRQVLRTQ